MSEESEYGPDEIVVGMNEKHFVLRHGGQVWIGEEEWDYSLEPPRKHLDLMTVQAARYLYKPYSIEVPTQRGVKLLNPIDIWMGDPRRRAYRQLVFRPDMECPDDCYNLWKGFQVEAKEGDCGLYWALVRDVICAGNQEHYKYVRKYLAHMVQKPADLPGTALVLRGGQGIGKDTFVEPLARILGQHAISLHSMDQVAGRFNSHLSDKILVQANEAFWGGDRAREGLVKGMITDSRIAIEAKGKDIIYLPNYRRLIVVSNNRWPVPIDPDDRRFLVLEVSDEHKEDIEYFAALRAQTAAGGTEALLWDLLHEDLGGWRPIPVPLGSGLDIKLRTGSIMDNWWYEKLTDGGFPNYPDSIVPIHTWRKRMEIAEVHEDLLHYCQKMIHRHPPTKTEMTEYLTRIAGVTVTRPAHKSDTKRPRAYLFPELEIARVMFQKYAKQPNLDWMYGGTDAGPEKTEWEGGADYAQEVPLDMPREFTM